jgi:hypothetical protein
MIHQIERHADPSTIDCTLRIRCSITPGGKHQLEAHFVHSTLQSVISWKHILYIPLCKKCDQLEAHCVHTTLQKCYQLEAHLVHSILQKVLLAGSTLCTYHSAKSVISWKHTLYIPLCKKFCYPRSEELPAIHTIHTSSIFTCCKITTHSFRPDKRHAIRTIYSSRPELQRARERPG